MRFIVVGCSYKTAPVAVRQRLAFSDQELPAALQQLRLSEDLHECLILSTCNRVEIYSVVSRAQHAQRTIRQFLSRSRGIDPQSLDEVLYCHQDQQAVSHIFRVTSSLDAMVIGEAQIGGQVKDAYSAAAGAKTIGPWLSRCMHRAFAAAKRARSETQFARHPVSVSSVAADLAARIFGDLSQSTVLVLGAGEMAELAVRHLLADGASDIRVLNRTYERAVELAFQLGAKACRYQELTGQLLLADIVISSVSSPEPILTRQLLGKVMRSRKQRPLFVVDIAVPQNVEPAANELANVYLFNIDDLERVVAENLKERRKEARLAERILAQEVARFEEWLRKQDAVPVIKQLRGHFSAIARAEAERTAHALQISNGKQRELLDLMADAIVNKLLHQPTVQLKKHAAQPDGLLLGRAASRLFQLPPQEEGVAEPADLSQEES